MLNRNEIGNLLLRIILGLVFLANGASKFKGGIENTVSRNSRIPRLCSGNY